MPNANLHDVVRIKNMAQALAGRGKLQPDEALEVADAYERLREQARALYARAWPDDDSFDREVPALTAKIAVQRLPRAMMGSQGAVDAVARGNRAVVLAQQLAAWAGGHQEAFEIEARLEASAKQSAEVAAKPGFGFGGSTAES